MSKLYNIGAYGIPEKLVAEVVVWRLRLWWSSHAKRELLNDQYGCAARLPVGACPVSFCGNLNWGLVELETDDFGHACKIVVRRQVDLTRSLVLVILRESRNFGVVKTCWINLNTDNHNTLDKSKFSKI